jgi:S-formylglutathione hydrolase FrmB
VAAAWREAFSTQMAMATAKAPPMIHVFLDPSCPGGHHAFADSVNNGPWGRALTTEFIAHLEKKFDLVAKPQARFLTGHSSGGWSSLWLQITYPDFFGGTWSTAPDPVDLRNYTGINVTPGSKDNAYREPDGSPKQLVRGKGKWLASFEDFARQEEVIGEYGGQFASFEWVWSPRGPDGRPLQLFNRATGVLNPAVLDAWQRYDIRRILETNWETLAPKLEGKLNLFCGSEDQFRLNESFELLRAFLKTKGSTAVCELIEGRSHSDLGRPHPSYPQGLTARIQSEMAAKFAAVEKTSPAGSEEVPAPK